MKCKGCVWGTRINEKVIFCMIPENECWNNTAITTNNKKTKKKFKKKLECR